MKNLKKMAVMAALIGAAHGAKAQIADFAPTQDGGEITGLAQVNGHLLVRANGGRVGDVDMPYTFINTDTNDFAKAGFAFKEMADTSSMVTNAGVIYTTRESDPHHVYGFTVYDRPELAGVGSTQKFDVTNVTSVVRMNGQVYANGSDGLHALTGAEPQAIEFTQGVTNYTDKTGNKYYISNSDHSLKYEGKTSSLGTVLGTMKGFMIQENVDSTPAIALSENEKGENLIYRSADIQKTNLTGPVARFDSSVKFALLPNGQFAVKTADGSVSYYQQNGQPANNVVSNEDIFSKSVQHKGLTYGIYGKKKLQVR